MKKALIFILLSFGFTHLFAQQEILYLDNIDPVFSFQVPDGWKCEKKEKIFYITSGKGFSLKVYDTGASTLDEAENAHNEFIFEFLDSPDIVSETMNTDYAFDYKNYRGEALDNARAVEFSARFFKIKDRVMLMLFYAPEGNLSRYKENIENIMASISEK